MEIAVDRFWALTAKLGEGRIGLCEDGRVSDAEPVPPTRPWAEPWRTIGVTGTNGKTSTTVLAAAAILAAGRHVFSSTTLDYRIDGMSAETFVEEARKANAEVPVVLLTGSHDIADLAAKMKVFDSLGKPFDIDDLVARANKALAANR